MATLTELTQKAGNHPLEIARRARDQVAELTGYKPVAIIGLFHDDQGWHITMDMLEMTRIPPSSDLLGIYECLTDEEGNLLSFERKMTHLRGDVLEPTEQ